MLYVICLLYHFLFFNIFLLPFAKVMGVGRPCCCAPRPSSPFLRVLLLQWGLPWLLFGVDAMLFGGLGVSGLFSLTLPSRPGQSLSRYVRLFVTLQNTHFQVSWRPLVHECIPNIGL